VMNGVLVVQAYRLCAWEGDQCNRLRMGWGVRGRVIPVMSIADGVGALAALESVSLPAHVV
jgi:hypothetical protein